MMAFGMVEGIVRQSVRRILNQRLLVAGLRFERMLELDVVEVSSIIGQVRRRIVRGIKISRLISMPRTIRRRN